MREEKIKSKHDRNTKERKTETYRRKENRKKERRTDRQKERKKKKKNQEPKERRTDRQKERRTDGLTERKKKKKKKKGRMGEQTNNRKRAEVWGRKALLEEGMRVVVMVDGEGWRRVERFTRYDVHSWCTTSQHSPHQSFSHKTWRGGSQTAPQY